MSTTQQRPIAVEKDLDKFIKFFAQKTAQVVVQSRLGEQVQTRCNPDATGNDWFNIVIQDHPDVSAETKRALNLSPGESILQRLPLCIEISLKTVEEGDKMVLEVWSVDLQQQQKDKDEKSGSSPPTNTITTAKGDVGEGVTLTSEQQQQQSLKIAQAIYNRMGILLKSLISLTRATPAYKLSRRQCADSYGIFYRIYADRPEVHTLGEGHKYVRIGHLNTISGAVSLSVAYRTKMTITPSSARDATRVRANNAIMLKSDHFRPVLSNIHAAQPLSAAALKKPMAGINGSKVIDIDKPLRPGAFTEISKLRQYTEDDYVLPETPPFEWLLRCGSSDGSIESLNRKCDSPLINCNDNFNHNYNTNALYNNNNVTAFKSFEKDQRNSTLPSSTLKQSLLINADPSSPPTTNSNNSPQTDEENLLKELTFPFATHNTHVNDLAKFYRDCYHAPPLRGLSELQSVSGVETSGCSTLAYVAASNASDSCVNNAVDDLSRQLEQFETSLEDYDKLVSQLGLTSASSSTGSRSSGGLQMSN